MTRIFHRFFMWKMDPISGFAIRLVFTLPPRDSTLQYKRCLHFWNNFPCLTILAPNMILNFIGLFRFRVFTFPVDGLDLSRMNSLSFLRSTTVSPSGFCCIWIYTTTFTTEIKNCALYFLRVYCLSRANIIFVFVYNIYSWIC